MLRSARGCDLTFLRCIFTTRRYASAVLPSRVRLSVRQSVTSPYCIETTGRIELVFGTEAFLPLCHTENGNLQIIGYFPWDCVPNSGLRKSIALSTNSSSSSSSSSTVELVDDIYTTIDESWLLTTNLSTVTL